MSAPALPYPSPNPEISPASAVEPSSPQESLPSDVLYLRDCTPETFTVAGYLSAVASTFWPGDPSRLAKLEKVLSTSRGRILATKGRPLLFALVYLRSTITMKEGSSAGQITMSDMALDFFRNLDSWLKPNAQPRQNRHMLVAPRNAGKSSLIFMILPIYLICHATRREFICAFGAKQDKAKERLSAIRTLLENHPFLRSDFPGTHPARRGSYKESDTVFRLKLVNGCTFYVSGVGSGGISGQLEDDVRPTVILLDDPEQSGEAWSPRVSQATLGTIRDVILPLSQYARVFWAGTAVGYLSLVHQAVRHEEAKLSQTSEIRAEDWVDEERFVIHWYQPVVEVPETSTASDNQLFSDRLDANTANSACNQPHPDATRRRSFWPAMWSMEVLDSEPARTFALNFANNPLSAGEGTWWRPELIKLGRLEMPPGAEQSLRLQTFLTIDPAISSKKTSDYSGIGVIAYSRTLDTFEILHIEQRKLSPEGLRIRLRDLKEQFPDATYLLCEENQGKDFVKASLLPEPIPGLQWRSYHAAVSKDQRASRMLTEYEYGRVLHRGRFIDYETQLLGWAGEGSIPNDDLIDTASQVIVHIRDAERKQLDPDRQVWL